MLLCPGYVLAVDTESASSFTRKMLSSCWQKLFHVNREVCCEPNLVWRLIVQSPVKYIDAMNSQHKKQRISELAIKCLTTLWKCISFHHHVMKQHVQTFILSQTYAAYAAQQRCPRHDGLSNQAFTTHQRGGSTGLFRVSKSPGSKHDEGILTHPNGPNTPEKMFGTVPVSCF